MKISLFEYWYFTYDVFQPQISDIFLQILFNMQFWFSIIVFLSFFYQLLRWICFHLILECNWSVEYKYLSAIYVRQDFVRLQCWICCLLFVESVECWIKIFLIAMYPSQKVEKACTCSLPGVPVEYWGYLLCIKVTSGRVSSSMSIWCYRLKLACEFCWNFCLRCFTSQF